MKSVGPMCPSSCPLFAVKMISVVGGQAMKARRTSSQQTIPPPRSEAQFHQALRGVITTKGGRSGRVPFIVATTFFIRAGTRFAQLTKRTGALRKAAAVN